MLTHMLTHATTHATTLATSAAAQRKIAFLLWTLVGGNVFIWVQVALATLRRMHLDREQRALFDVNAHYD